MTKKEYGYKQSINIFVMLLSVALIVLQINSAIGTASKVGYNGTIMGRTILEPTNNASLDNPVIEISKQGTHTLKISPSSTVATELTIDQKEHIKKTIKEKKEKLPHNLIHFKSGYEYSVNPIDANKIDKQNLSKTKYNLIQFYDSLDTMDKETRDVIKKSGIILRDYIPNNGFYAKIPPSATESIISLINNSKIRYVGPIPAQAKINQQLVSKIQRNPDESYQIAIHLFEEPTENQLTILKKYMNIYYYSNVTYFVYGNSSGTNITNISNLDIVKWMEERVPVTILNNDASTGVADDIVQFNGYTGSGVRVAIVDSGIAQQGSTYHDDLPSSRIADQHDFKFMWPDDDIAEDGCGHGTHVAGIIGGSGSRNNKYRGMAPDVTFLIYKMFGYIGECGGLQSYFQFDNAADRAAKNDANIISNSWGGGNGQYDSNSEIADKLVRGEFNDSGDNPQYMNVVAAAGNDNSGINAPGTAKNAITVGAAKDGNSPLSFTGGCSDNDWPQGQTVCFSNFGPLDIDNDGNQRIKPDVIAPGVRITSTTPWYQYDLYDPQVGMDYYYGTMDGTSMATPVVSGAVATLLQAYPSVKDWPEMVKARVINTAINAGNSQAKEGHGMIDSYHMIYSDSAFQNLLWVGDSLDFSNISKTYYFDVPSGFKEVKATLTWSDPAGASEVTNDLDLFIYDANGSLVGSSSSFDDTVEKVVTTSGVPGRWKATISATSLNNAPQHFGLSAGAIIVNPSLNLIANSNKTYIGRNDTVNITTELSNNGYTALGSYISVEIPNGISLDSVDFYRADGTKLNYPLSEIYRNGNVYYLATGELINGYVRRVDWLLKSSSTIADGSYSININGAARNTASTSSKNVVIQVTSGRTGGPDLFGYTFKDSYTPNGPAYDWIEISGTGTQVLSNSDDSWVGNINLGFFFNYYGTDYSQLAISNNGLMFSGGTTWEYVNNPITQTSSVHGFMAPLWDDLITYDSQGAGAVYYQTLGTAPNRMFVVEWYDNKHYGSSDSGVTFEAVLYEGSNNIKFQYKDVDFGNVYNAVGGDNPPYNNGGSATVGIEGPTGDVGLQYSFDEAVINPGLAILFKFPAFSGTNMYLTKNAPASMDYGNTMTYTLYINNFGSVAASNVVLEDILPSNVEFVSASDGGTYDSIARKVTWNIGSVAVYPSGRGSRTVTVRIPSSVPVGTVIRNTASISTSTIETRYDDNSAAASTAVTGSNLPPDVSIGPTNGNTGGTPSVYWGTPVTFTYYSSCATNVGINIHVNDGGSDITGSMLENTPDTWTYTTTFYPRHGAATVTYTLSGCSTPSVAFNIYIDPAGYIYDANTGARISGATVWLQRPDGFGDWENVPTGQTPPISQPDVNPLTTGADGQYQWDVLEGSYRVHVEAPGYYPADSIVVSVPPPVTDLHVGLTRLPDAIPPVTTAILYGSPGNNGWYTSDVQVNLTATDNEGGSGVNRIDFSFDGINWNTYNAPLTIANEGTTAVYYRSADNAGNVETTKTQTINIDKTPPIITGAPTTSPNANGWYNSNIVINFTASDSISGVDTVTPDTPISTEGASQSMVGTATDRAGNSNNTTVSGINIDKTPPQIVIYTPANESVYILNQTLTANWSAYDSLSGIASVTGTVPNGSTIDTGIVGAKTFNVAAADNASNSADQNAFYIIAYNYLGILPPIKADNSSIFKSGSTVPVKFRIVDANGNNMSTAVANLTYQKITDEILGTIEEPFSTSAADSGNTFRYDDTDNLYIFNLGTSGMDKGTYQLNINLDDGTVHTVRISIKL